MDSSASKVGSGEIGRHGSMSHPPSKLKTYGFAIAIIMGIGGLAVEAAGIAGYFHVGALSNMSAVDAIIMMAAGGGGGISLLIIGVVGAVKSGATSKSKSMTRAEIIKSVETQNGLVYGPEAWKIWNVEVLDVVPPAPQVDLSKKDKVLLYIPKRIRVEGKEQDLTLKALKEISGGPFRYFSEDVLKHLGDNVAPGGWILIDKNLIPGSNNKEYETLKQMVEERGYSMPSVFEAIVLNLMVFAFAEERLYRQESMTFTCCIEKVGTKHVNVGGFSLEGLFVCDLYCGSSTGVACVQRVFK